MGGSGSALYSPTTSKSGKSSDNVFQRSEDEAQKRITDYQRNVFISFDIDDKPQVSLLRSQAKDERFPFVFRDYSVKEPFENKWKARVREKIELTSAVIVAIGKNTHKSEAVDWEIREAHRQGKKIIGVRLHSDQNHGIPSAMKEHGDRVIKWNTKKIGDELGKDD